MQSPYLSIENVSAAYDSKENIVNDVSFDLLEGELGCLLGPSGCGKTTILRAISGFQNITGGAITLAGETLSSTRVSVAPENRGVGMVFQDHALFPHLSLSDNIGFGLDKLNRAERTKQIEKMLELVGMREYHDSYPHEISGGQSQRIALARALAPEPTLLLMDEPFSNLDTSLRESLGYEVRQMLKETGITAIMVTHDQHDAFALGDQVGVILDGQLEQWGSPFELYHTPQSRFVASFIGDGVFINGNIENETTAITALGEIQGQVSNRDLVGKQVELLIRPDDVVHDPDGNVSGVITRKAFKGAQTLYTVITHHDTALLSLVPSHDDYEIGDSISLRIDADHLVCFAKNSAAT